MYAPIEAAGLPWPSTLLIIMVVSKIRTKINIDLIVVERLKLN
jgi:hypothetical protein